MSQSSSRPPDSDAAARAISSALASMLFRASLITKYRPMKIKAMPSIRKLARTTDAVAMKFLK